MRADAQRNRARILAAADEIFAAKGASASTEEVAARAGVAIGTVFRHFPTKNDLLSALMKELVRELAEEVESLVRQGDPATSLFTFFAHLVERAASRKTVVELLGIDILVSDQLQLLREAVGILLDQAQAAGVVRAGVRLDEVMALLAATSQGALHSGWDADLRERTLAVVFTGLRSAQL
ncbi:helix-turn-helix domain-containing protein [Umezawaea sp. Da 62-37]|uniref:TetR/AcrR family transcriptional regulator n=1 Tax=Umezawaea sp. Da 62-37 TaxID=3075927 RepID=UPI0028F74CFD|nr:helix-turn-helix domain-containing protein [Umezawaea sp. Da 62-37]WNV83302.1 helix-turn-helix domain-containing protein [Umezawaea sp. Da 62-37]